MNKEIPKGLVPLEIIFYRHDRYKPKKEVSTPNDYLEINIGTKESPKMIKVGTIYASNTNFCKRNFCTPAWVINVIGLHGS
jgi:hypothetical protein